MITNDEGVKITPRKAAKFIIMRKLTAFVNHEDIPEYFKDITEKELEAIAEHYWKIFERIEKQYL